MRLNGKWIKEEEIYVNRYGDLLKFTRISELEFIMSGGQLSQFVKISRDPAGNLLLIDPPGGPMIMATPAMIWKGEGEIYTKNMSNNMGEFSPQWKDLIIVELEWTTEVKIKCLPVWAFEEMKWEKIK
jgi:hypothetical protein